MKQQKINKNQKYYVGSGNNSQRIRKLMRKRPWWQETNDKQNPYVNFKWQQSPRGYNYNKLNDLNQFKQMLNHFEFLNQIANKQNLIKNLFALADQFKINIFENITPITYIIDFEDEYCESYLNNFLKFYENNIPYNQKKKLGGQNPENLRKMLKQQQKSYGIYPTDKLFNHIYLKQNFHETFVDQNQSSYIWILKPTFLNRGRGINLFNSFSQLEKIVGNYLEGFEEKILKKKTQEDVPKNTVSEENDLNLSIIDKTKEIIQQQKLNLQNNKTSPSNIIKANKFVIQKYVEKPLLLNNRKFDIRVWVLLTHELELFYFREGYIRLTSQEYSINENSIENQFVHLTNNAIQKYSEQYGQYEDGNMWTMEQLWKYLYEKDKSNSIEYYKNKIVQKIQNLILITFCSIKKHIINKERKFCFEIFGFDFLVDQNLNTWLLEVNTNPAIDECSNILKVLVPRMLDDAFKLTVDKVFLKQNLENKNEVLEENEQQDSFDNNLTYHVNGYDDDFNLWESLLNFKEVNNINIKKYLSLLKQTKI